LRSQIRFLETFSTVIIAKDRAQTQSGYSTGPQDPTKISTNTRTSSLSTSNHGMQCKTNTKRRTTTSFALTTGIARHTVTTSAPNISNSEIMRTEPFHAYYTSPLRPKTQRAATTTCMGHSAYPHTGQSGERLPPTPTTGNIRAKRNTVIIQQWEARYGSQGRKSGLGGKADSERLAKAKEWRDRSRIQWKSESRETEISARRVWERGERTLWAFIGETVKNTSQPASQLLLLQPRRRRDKTKPALIH
jgi:hypothetical protein